MKAHYIRLRPDRLNLPLATCFVGKLSSAEFIICGDIPDDIEGLSVQIGRTADPATHQPRENFTASASPISCGAASAPSPTAYRCYLSPFLFPDISADLQYHVIGLDSAGAPRWLGTGSLIVSDNPAGGSPVVPDIIPADTYIRNPATGRYHKLTAALDSDGNITIDLASEGVER